MARARAIIPTIKQNGTTVPRPNRVTIVIIPYNFTEKPRASQPFKQAVCRYLDAHRQLTAAIEISDPDYVRVSVNAEIKIKTGYHPEQIQERISEALDHFLSPLKRTPDDNEWPFGRPVYYSEIAEIIEKIDGVDCIPRLALSASEGSYQLSEGNVEIGPLSIVYPGTHTIQVIDLYDRCKNTGEKKQTESKE